MKLNKSNLVILVFLVVAAALYRAWDGRPFGFAPQIAMALFAGAVCRDKRFAFLFPVLSMLVSDLLYQFLYLQGLSNIKGFYGGLWQNYLLIASVTIIGFYITHNKPLQIIAGSLIGAVYYFILSNFLVWIGGGLNINNQPYEKSFAGLMECFTAALPFFRWSVISTLFFNGVFFGGYYLLGKNFLKKELQSA
jgi:hypothetical protein